MKIFVIIFFVPFFCSAQQQYYNECIVGSQKIKSGSVYVEPFSRIFASCGPVELDPSQSSNVVFVQSDENILDELSISTCNGTLYIGPKNPSRQLFLSHLKIFVGIYDCNKLSLAGNALYRFISEYTGDKFQLEISGQASCIIECNVNNLEVIASQDSRLSCAGAAKKYEVLMYDNALVDISKLLGQLVYSKQHGKAQLTNLSVTEQ